MTEADPKPELFVSLHDIWPGNYIQADADLQWLRKRGVASCGIFVVPCYHGQKPIEEEPAFLDWVKTQMEMGATLFAHGTHHLTQEKRGEKIKRNAFGKWVNSLIEHEGEFAGLAPDFALELLQRSLRHFNKASLDPMGWVFPTWIGSLPNGFDFPPSFRFLDGRFFVHDLQTKRKQWMPPLTFGVGPETTQRFVHGGPLAIPFLKSQKKVRLALHPGDLKDAKIGTLVEQWLTMRKPMGYTELFPTKGVSCV